MDTLVEVRDVINSNKANTPVKVDWSDMSITSPEFGKIELFPGGQWAVNGAMVKNSQFKKMLGMKASERELWFEKLKDIDETGYVVPVAPTKPLFEVEMRPDLTFNRDGTKKDKAGEEPPKKERKKRAPMSEEQRKAAAARLVLARAARGNKKAETSTEGGISSILE